MAVKAAFDDYSGPIRDKVENFHGNQLVFVAWDDHLISFILQGGAIGIADGTPMRQDITFIAAPA